MKKSESASFPITKKQTFITKKVPRPMNCFMTFRVEKQKEILNKCPGANHRDISKIVAKWWREFPDHKKEPYRIKAALAKAKHLENYPDYKYSPRKKTSTRSYKRRDENVSAREYRNKYQLFSLYRDGTLLDSSDDSNECILEEKPIKKDIEIPKKTLSKSPVVESQLKLYSTSENNTCFDTIVGNQPEIPNSTDLLNLPVNDMIYNCDSSVLYQPVVSSSFTNHDDTQPILPSYSVPSHFNTFDQFCEFDNALMYTTNLSTHCLPLNNVFDTFNFGYQDDTSFLNPSLLTNPFYYQPFI